MLVKSTGRRVNKQWHADHALEYSGAVRKYDEDMTLVPTRTHLTSGMCWAKESVLREAQ